MRFTVVFAAAALALSLTSVASADAAHDRAVAINVCRADVAQRAGVEQSAVRLANVRAHARHVRVDLDLWRAGAVTNVHCDVALGGDTPTIASIDPPVMQASAQN